MMMVEHPHDASDPSSADGPAVDAPPSLTADQGYLRRDRPPPRTADDIAALTIDRDDARAALYRAHADMGKVREDCDALRAEVGQTFKQLCDAATLAGVWGGERDEARAELAASQAREATLLTAVRAEKALLDHVATCPECDQCDYPCDEWASLSGTAAESCRAALADPSPVADALARVARAAVEYVLDDSVLDSSDIDRAVRSLLAVAPHWGEPRGGG